MRIDTARLGPVKLSSTYRDLKVKRSTTHQLDEDRREV